MSRRIWVIRESAMGDVVLCEPTLAALAAAHPGARVGLVTRAAYHPLFRHHPDLGELLTPEAAWRTPAPDWAIDLQNRPRTRLLAARARRRTHWRKRRGLDLLRTLGGRPLHRDYRGGPHQLTRIAAAVGLTPDRRPRLHLGAAALEAGQGLAPTGPLVVLAPAARHPLKRWPEARFHQLAARLRRSGAQVAAVGGPGEEQVLAASVQGFGAVLPVDAGLDVLAAVLGRAAVVVGNDTGWLHVAAAVGTPVVAIFGPTAPGRWGPDPAQGLSVARDLPCAPCSDHGRRPCVRGDHVCLREMPVEAVFEAVDRLAKFAAAMTEMSGCKPGPSGEFAG